MGRVILYLHMSLDNVVSEPERWMLMNDEVLRSAIEYYDRLDIVMFGSKTYPFLADYWPNAERNSPSNAEREFASKINQKRKIVLSRSSVNLTWKNSELLKFTDIQSLSQSLYHLKEKEGKNISVESGIGIWRLFLDNSLFDELFISLHPIIIGQGLRLFTEGPKKHELSLLRTRTFNNGVVELHYSKR